MMKIPIFLLSVSLCISAYASDISAPSNNEEFKIDSTIQNYTTNEDGKTRNIEEIQSTVNTHKNGIYMLYVRSLRENPLLEGRLHLQFNIDSSGNVTDIIILASELEDQILEAAILKRVSIIKFLPSDVPKTTINQTFEFHPN
jgi:TonB family protein